MSQTAREVSIQSRICAHGNQADVTSVMGVALELSEFTEKHEQLMVTVSVRGRVWLDLRV